MQTDEHAMEPRVEPVRIAEAAKVAPGDHQRILQGILGPVDVAKDPVGDRVEPVAPQRIRSANAARSPRCAASTRSTIHARLALTPIGGVVRKRWWPTGVQRSFFALWTGVRTVLVE